MDYNNIRKIAAAQSSKPIAGRTVIPGYNIDLTTLQTQKPEQSPYYSSSNDIETTTEEQMKDDISNESSRESVSQGNTYSQSLEPDSRGFAGDYHKDDLKKQYEELMLNSTPEELDLLESDLTSLENGTFKSKYLKGGSSYSPGEEEEAVRFLGSAIRYGRR